MKSAIVTALVMGTLLPGCIDLTGQANGPAYRDRTLTAILPSEVAPANRSVEEYYFVLVSGGDRAEHVRGPGNAAGSVCDRAWTYSYDLGGRTLEYSRSDVTLDAASVAVVVAFDYHGTSVSSHGVGEDCASTNALHAFNSRARAEEVLRGDLGTRIIVEAQNGFLTYNETYFLPLGKKAHTNLTRVLPVGEDTYYLTGDFEVVNLGPWPRSGLRPR